MNKNLKPFTTFNRLSWLLYVVMGLAVAIIAGMVTIDYYADAAAEQAIKEEIKNRELYTTIRHLDEVLTMSAHMAAATGDVRWEDRYLHYEPILNSAIKETIRLYPDEYAHAGARQIDDANQMLVDMERQVLTLARDGKHAAAASIINSKEYYEQKNIYADGMQQFLSATLGNSQRMLDNVAEKSYQRLALLIPVLALFIVCVFVFRQARSLIIRQMEVENELLQHRNYLQAIMDAITDPIFVKDKQSAWKSGNLAFWKLMEGSAERFVGRNGEDIFPAGQFALFQEKDGKVIRTGQPNVSEEYITTPSGKTILALTTRSPLTMPDGLPGLVGVIRDITERRQFEDEIRQMQRIIEYMGEGVFAVNLSGHTTFVNKTAERMLGYTLEEMRGIPQHDLLHHRHPDGTPYAPEQCNLCQAFTAGKAYSTDLETFWRKDHSPLSVEYTSAPKHDAKGNVSGAVVVFRDIAERKLAEQEKLARIKAEGASRLKSQFLTNVTHELKTPVHCIINFAQIGAADCDKAGAGALKEHFNDIFANGKRLDMLISDLLDLSKIESGSMTFELDMYPIRAMVENAVNFTRGLADAKRLRIDTTGILHDEHVIVDARRTEQVFINLMSNAIRFTPEEGYIRWRSELTTMPVCASSFATPALALTIENEGQPIPENELESIFSHFVQGKAAISNGGGTGLGLAICRQFLQTFHGTIRALNTEKGHAAFEIVLPLWNRVASATSNIREEYHA